MAAWPHETESRAHRCEKLPVNVVFLGSDYKGVVDYRMPPTWEYTAGGFRAPGALAGDLGLITR